MADLNYAVLTFGTPKEVIAELDQREPALLELRAALYNALQRVELLETQVGILRKREANHG